MPVRLERNSVVAKVQEPTQKSLAVWTVYDPDSSDEEEEEPVELRRALEQELEQTADHKSKPWR